MSTNKLLTPDNHARLLIDQQYLQLVTLRSPGGLSSASILLATNRSAAQAMDHRVI
jgi:hypothetical protein